MPKPRASTLIPRSPRFAWRKPTRPSASPLVPTRPLGTSNTSPAPTQTEIPQTTQPRRRRAAFRNSSRVCNWECDLPIPICSAPRAARVSATAAFRSGPAFFACACRKDAMTSGPITIFRARIQRQSHDQDHARGRFQHNFRSWKPKIPMPPTRKNPVGTPLGSYPYLGVGLSLVATKLRVPAIISIPISNWPRHTLLRAKV